MISMTRASGSGKAVEQFGVEEACEVAVEAFVSTDQFIAKAEARHESSLFKPEYGAKIAREENTFTAANATMRSAKLA